jgi:hypothetical protein
VHLTCNEVMQRLAFYVASNVALAITRVRWFRAL